MKINFLNFTQYARLSINRKVEQSLTLKEYINIKGKPGMI